MSKPAVHHRRLIVTAGVTAFGLVSVTAMVVCYALERRSRWFILTFVMGAFFIGGQIYEYTELVSEGVS